MPLFGNNDFKDLVAQVATGAAMMEPGDSPQTITAGDWEVVIEWSDTTFRRGPWKMLVGPIGEIRETLESDRPHGRIWVPEGSVNFWLTKKPA